MRIRILTAIILMIFTTGDICGQAVRPARSNGKPKNIILMIGDGMGLTQVYIAYTIKRDKMNVIRCPYIGLVNVTSYDDLITDSAASATAMSTGKKTNNGAVGVDPSGNKLKTILEIAEERGKSTGLVATSEITHATPAAFIAHQPDRDNHEGIALDFLNTDIDVFIGGGRKYFEKRTDNLNLLDSLRSRNYNVVTDLKDIEFVSGGKLAGLVFDKAAQPAGIREKNYLEKASIKAIELLDQDIDGFFIMIEGSQIDWAGHDNDLDYLINETLDFDDTIGKMLDFASRDGETLVIITSDHETGGLTIPDGSLSPGSLKVNFSTINHTAVFVPLFAFGPGSENFTGIYENTEIYNKIYDAFGF